MKRDLVVFLVVLAAFLRAHPAEGETLPLPATTNDKLFIRPISAGRAERTYARFTGAGVLPLPEPVSYSLPPRRALDSSA